MKRSEEIIKDNERTLSAWRVIIQEDIDWNAQMIIAVLKNNAQKVKSKQELSNYVRKIEKLGVIL